MAASRGGTAAGACVTYTVLQSKEGNDLASVN